MNEPSGSGEQAATEGADEQHETARQLTEDALGAYAKGDDKKGDKLVEQAKKADPSAVQEVMQDLEEDAGSDHSVPGSKSAG